MSARRVMAGALVALALAVAGCGDSPEDEAHADGKDVGTALRQLYDANSPAEIQTAATDVKNAVANVSTDVSDRVRKQVATQTDTIQQGVSDAQAAASGSDPNAQDAKTALDQTITELRSQAASFAQTNDSVTNSFWDGVKDGYDDD